MTNNPQRDSTITIKMDSLNGTVNPNPNPSKQNFSSYFMNGSSIVIVDFERHILD
jgi:hypothetical protein